MGWNEGASLAERWGRITQQLWHVPKDSYGREEQDASCLVTDALCPAAAFGQRAGREAGFLLAEEAQISP